MLAAPNLAKGVSVNYVDNIDETMDDSPTINSTPTAKLNSNPLLMNKGSVNPDDVELFMNNSKKSNWKLRHDEHKDGSEIRYINIGEIESHECSDCGSNIQFYQFKRKKDAFCELKNCKNLKMQYYWKSNDLKATKNMHSYEILMMLKHQNK